MRAIAFAVVLFLWSHDAYASCPEVDREREKVHQALAGDSTSELQGAYEAHAEAWLCAHPGATADELAEWSRKVPSQSASNGAEMPVLVVDARHVFVVWRRSDQEAGGRGVLYGSSKGGGWRAGAAVELSGRPEVVGVIEKDVVFVEHHNSGRVDRLDLRSLRIRGADLIEGIRVDDLRTARIVSARKRVIKVVYQREPKYTADGSTPALEYELTLTPGKRSLNARTKALTPALDALDAYCGAEDAAARRKHVSGAALASKLPTCEALTVTALEQAGRGAVRLSIESSLVCLRGGEATPIRAATIVISPQRRKFRITGLLADDCDQVRARRDAEAL